MAAADLSILRWMREHPAQIGRWCGFDKLTDDLHGEWMRQMISGQGDMTLLSHRGSFKTTCLSVALGILLATDPHGNNIFMRKSESDVVEIVTQVAKLILSPPFQELTRRAYGDEYGPIRLTQASGTIVNTDVNAAAKGAPQLLGIGTSGSMTGKHADRVFTDDIVNLQDRASKAERQRICRIYMELQNIRNPGGRIINTGTPWHKEDAISTLMPNIQRYDYNATGLLTDEKLEELRRSMDPSLFAANYELKHIAAENALFASYPEKVSDPDWLRDGFAHIDAAYGGEDYTALTCASRIGDKIYLYGRLWHGHVDTVLDAAMAECERLMCGPIYCETNGDKGYLAKEIRARGGTAHPYAEKQNKYIKISSYLKKWWENICVLEGTDQAYIDQIMDYTEDAEHDDAPDSAASIIRILDRRG